MSHIRSVTGLVPQPWRFQLRKTLYGGPGRTCPECGTTVRRYLSHGGGLEVLERRRVVGGMLRENDRCPVCHGRDRTRLMMLYLEKHAALSAKPVRLLHVAPDFSLYLWFRTLKDLDYVASDIDASRYRHIPGAVTADLTDAPFEDSSFDYVVCSHVIEHIPNDRKAMAEILRILKPGGEALLLVPFADDGAGTDEDPSITDTAERERRFGQWDHVRLYDRSDFVERLASVGFDVTLFDAFQSDPAAAEELHLNPLELLPVARRPTG